MEILCRLHPARDISAKALMRDLKCSNRDLDESLQSLRDSGFDVHLVRRFGNVCIGKLSYERAEHSGGEHIDRMLRVLT